MMVAKIKVDVRDKIVAKLKELERSVSWLAKHAGIPYYSLYACIVKKQFNVSDENLEKVNVVLGTSFKNTAPKK